ncbi:hypothetical protein AAV35_005425 [Salimicrobium jeotgali]|uniref:Uncharacterized protein n=1 Tax=Salimicrobium jeotgali TaxID=1230341 RepID=A0AAC8PRH1_9BACI|nr:hypothetical protein [Salimicrobium jeotgali]AKG04282.1 hypothetical protein AAV35_005425 [Salimicrobium jeotgali]
MGDLISVIFSNIFIVGAVLYGIFSLFQRSQENREDNSPSSVPERQNSPAPSLNEKYEEMKEHADQDFEEENVHVEKASEKKHDGILQHGDLVVDKKEDETKEVHPFLRENWTKRRIQDGIIMSEILGPPRAKRPHRPLRRW